MVHYKISFAGAGKVAGALCREVYSAGHSIELVVSDSEKSSLSLAGLCNASSSVELRFPDTSDLIIVAVPDHRLKDVLEKIKCGSSTLVVHTAGSIGLEVFPGSINHKGVLYPLQTFSKDRKVDFRDLPFFLEYSDDESLKILQNLVKSIRGRICFADTRQRIYLHLAAVYVSNFTNHMLTLGKEIASNAEYPFEVLLPLINETVAKALEIGPENSQTGPAIRDDKNTMEKHLKLLSFSPELERIYREMSGSIKEYYKKS
jgi:predicted short-subunit dehydrogenase-like oxidoreductase (DUF2520 family)